MKRLSYILTGLVVCLAILLAINAWQLYRPALDFSCSSLFEQENTGDDFHMISNTLFTFTPDKAGFISMDGTVNHRGREYKLRRDIRFIYKHAGGNKWQLSQMDVIFAGSDQVPAGVVERNFYSTDKKKNGIFIYIAPVKDIPGAWIISGLYSPAFMCVSNSS
ncbi:hypothetical protein [Enterobacter asburiae]|uniref:hypothetical protein n=1 Tax=Enterobacter asburiae TaxID=61645 RepID=UPI000A270774|nr:hypothetical protein [Enterobacter asburiae]